jgi:hypothetical protein
MDAQLRELVLAGRVEQVKPGKLVEGEDIYRQADGRRSTVIMKTKHKDADGRTNYRLYFDEAQPGRTPYSTVYPNTILYRFVEQEG